MHLAAEDGLVALAAEVVGQRGRRRLELARVIRGTRSRSRTRRNSNEKRAGAHNGKLQYALSNTTDFSASACRCGVFTAALPCETAEPAPKAVRHDRRDVGFLHRCLLGLVLHCIIVVCNLSCLTLIRKYLRNGVGTFKLPLAGVRVLDLTRAFAEPCQHDGPCGPRRGDLIKVEPLGGDMIRNWGPFDRGTSASYLSGNRNKRGIAINFRDPRALELLGQLARQSDVVAENFRPGGR